MSQTTIGTNIVQNNDPYGEDWKCVCGNQPHTDGFYACDSAGNEVEPVPGWGGRYVCSRCEAIIDEGGTIIGQAVEGRTTLI